MVCRLGSTLELAFCLVLVAAFWLEGGYLAKKIQCLTRARFDMAFGIGSDILLSFDARCEMVD